MRSAIPLLLLLRQSSSEVTTVQLPRSGCPAPQVFDTSGLACVDCQQGLGPLDAEVCGCPANALQAEVDCATDSLWEGNCVGIACSTECSQSSQVPSLDKRTCIPCSNSAAFDTATNQCTCNNPAKSSASDTPVATQRLVEVPDDSGKPLRKDCVPCLEGMAVITEELYEAGQDYFVAAGRKYTADPSACASCPDPRMFFDTDYSCVCEDGYLLAGEASVGEQSCLKNAPSVAGPYTRVRFQSLDLIGDKSTESYDFTLESITFSHLYQRAAGDCEHFDGSSASSLQACQALGNLCVMSMYDEDAPACRQFEAILQRRVETYHDQEDWKVTLPWLRYSDDAESVANDRGVRTKVSFHPEDDRTNVLSFKLAKYTVNGTFVGLEDLANQFEYCYRSTRGYDDLNHTHWLTFGNTYRQEYSCSIDDLLEKETFLYDLYLVDEGSDACSGDSECLYPVPVLNRNLASDGKFPNVNQRLDDELDDIYTRRFFLFDNLSGRTTAGVEAVRYATKIVLRVPTRSENPDQLYPPQLVVEYATSTKSSDAELSLLFKVEYSMRSDSFWDTIQIWLGFIFAFAVVIFGFRVNNFQSRQRTDNAGSVFGLQLLLHAFVVACHTFTLLFGCFTFLICAYWFLFFKNQGQVFLLLPPESEFYGVTSEYLFFNITFRLLFWCQTIYIGYTIVRQCRSDVIFVDHERPPCGKRSNGVSMWRIFTVANAYNRLQGKRRSNTATSLVVVAFAMFGLGQRNNALPQPNFEQGLGRENIALSFANSVFFFIVAWLIQWMWRVLVQERFLSENPSTQFVDLITACNVSVFIMLENNKGFYLHGVSPYQTADCSVEEMLLNLEREGLGHFIGRGFSEATGDCQAFSLFASPVFRAQLSKIYGYALPNRSHIESNDGNKAALARFEMTQFLQGFVDQQPTLASTDGLSYIVREPLASERLLGVTPAEFRNAAPNCILLPDRDGFLGATFLGIELDLLLHDVLTYNCAQMAFGNAGISIFLCYAMHLLRTSLRAWWGSRNLAAKSFIDSKFLGISQ
ncbi:hypothetical protein ACHAXT_010219 [Thalassiosira profunda]